MVSIGNEQLGAMRQKIAIFKEGNSVSRVQNVFQELSFYIQKEMNSWGRCVRKWRFSKKETAFAGYNFFSGAKIATHLRIRVLTVKTRISHRGYTLSFDPVLDLSDQKQGPKDY